MNHHFHLSMYILILLCSIPAIAVTPTYKIRSQARDKTREIVGTAHKVYRADTDEVDDRWGFFSIIPEYTQSFRSGDICSCLFGNSVTSTTSNCNDDCGCCSIAIQGSGVTNRASNAWFADYFYLPIDFNGSIAFSPNIRNFIIDFDLFVGLDQCHEGMYCRFYWPFVHTRWDLDLCETITAAGVLNHPTGYFTPNALSNANLLHSFSSYASGNSPADPTSPTGFPTPSFLFNAFNPLRFAKMSHCASVKNGFAELRAELGWNFLQRDNYHVGVNIQGAAPTGSKMRAEWLFDPQLGNGHHWELGVGLTAHRTFWKSQDENRHASFHLDLNVTHLFKAHEQRTFDLKCKPMSRYMLAMQFGPNTQNLVGGSSTGTPASNQFTGTFSPIANLSTVNVDVSIGAQADLVAMFNFTVGRFSWDLGYNFWAQSCERFSCPRGDCFDCGTTCQTPFATLCDEEQTNTWGLKGNARMYGVTRAAGNPNPPAIESFQSVPLSATNSTATIFTGTTGNITNSSGADFDNGTIDNPQLAFAGGSPGIALLTEFLPAPAININTSIQPVFLSCADLDMKGVRGLSNKIFTHLNFTFDRDSRWVPYVGVGAFGEFGQSECSSGCSTSTTSSCGDCGDCQSGCRSCIRCSLSQWGIWLKGGVTYN